MNPYFQQPQLWVNTNKSTMIVFSRLCIIYRMNNGNSQSHQCISHFFHKCRHIFQAIQASGFFPSMWIIKRLLKGTAWCFLEDLAEAEKNLEPKACLPLQFKSCLKAHTIQMQKQFPRQSPNLCNGKHNYGHNSHCANSRSQTPSNSRHLSNRPDNNSSLRASIY